MSDKPLSMDVPKNTKWACLSCTVSKTYKQVHSWSATWTFHSEKKKKQTPYSLSFLACLLQTTFGFYTLDSDILLLKAKM